MASSKIQEKQVAGDVPVDIKEAVRHKAASNDICKPGKLIQ